MLRHTLDALFETMDVNSWTLHENKTSSVIILRFRDVDGDTKTNQRTSSFRKKSQKQLDRDRQRCQRLNRPITRSRSHLDSGAIEIENPRQNDESNLDSFSNLDISHVSTVSENSPPDSPFQAIDSPSAPPQTPLLNTDMAESTEAVSLRVQQAEIISADVDCDTSDVTQGAGAEVATKHSYHGNSASDSCRYISNLPDLLDIPLFRDHVIRRNETWAAMDCHDCWININKAAQSSVKMTYCANCDLYFCEKCLKKESICYCNSSPTFIT